MQRNDLETAQAGSHRFLGRRFLVALLTPLILLVGVGAVLGLQIVRMSESGRWVDHTNRVLVKTHELEQLMSTQEASARGYQLTGDSSYVDAYDRADLSEVWTSVRALVSDNPEQQVRLDAFKRVHADWKALADRSIQAQEVGKAIDRNVLTSRRKLALKSHEMIEEIRRVEDGLRRERQATLAASTEITKWAFVGLLTLTAVVLGFMSRRSLLEVSDTFGRAFGREREARTKIELEEWLRGGVLTVSNATRGELTVRELGTRTLSALAPYVNADVGAFFTRAPNGWQRLAGFALDTQAAGPEHFAEGEGLIGRAARSESVTHVEDVPADFMKLRSGLGETAPRHLLLVPARHENEVLAVLELGFLRVPEERTIHLLERIGEPVASALRSGLQRGRLNELLEESQRQAEELQTQQEELRVANEELHEQSSALQETQAQLRARQEELEASNVGLEEQTSELERVQQDLMDKATELERASQYKSEFLANMSHELRTPLNSALILAKLLSDNRDGNLTPEQIKFAATIYSAGNDLLTLINDILDLSKIEAGRLEVQPAPTSIRHIVAELTPTFTPVATERELEFSITLAPDLPEEIETDVQRLQQILKNLLSNAFKFTEEGSVELAISGSEKSVSFRVTDSGIGIPKTQQRVIFDAFRQADGTTHRKYGGTGLGLSISGDLARLLGGELTVESEPGRGSIFTLVLPRAYLGPSTAPRGVNVSALPATVSIVAPAARPPLRSQPAKPLVSDDRESLDKGRRLLLVVEDDIAFADILIDLAHELDFQCVVATSAEEGLRLANELLPAAVLLDVNLPDRSGLSVLDRLKRTSATRHIPVHVVSVADYSSQALAMGAMGYLLKPVKREQLALALKHMEERLTRRLNRVLVVEDDATQLDAICKLLSADDVETVAVSNVRDALGHLGTSHFDCVVTDLSLPDASGYDLLEQMAADGTHSFPPVIVYTGSSLSEEEEQQLRKYSSAIIVKGARSPERLLDEVTLFLHRVEAELPPERQRLLAQARDRETAFADRSILVVEDDVRNIFALSSILEPKGAKVLIARNGRQGLEMLEKNPDVDLVLMDIMMPEMDGLEATRLIRKRPEWKDLPIIALTAKAMRDDQEQCLRAGANDYLPKPLEVDTLLSLLRVWMRP